LDLPRLSRFIDVSVIENCVTALAVKFAVMFLFPLIIMLSGFVDPVASPLQPVKVKPVLGVAVIWTTLFESYHS